MTKISPYLLSTKQIFWILLSVVIAVLPHIPRLPFWFPILLITVVIIRWLTAKKQIKPLHGMLIAFITIAVFIAIIYFQGFKLNREISVTILTTMAVLKLLETWKKRDAWMIVTLCYFIILTRFFYSQDMLLVLYLLASVIIITHTLFVLQHNKTSHYLQKGELKQTLSLLATGLPLAVLFFLFFPRLGSPIWGSPDFFGEGKTGLSDEMSPGSISQLFEDDSTAFRVTFNGKIPSNSQLYWRGPVLWDFDGKTWKKNKGLKPVKKDLSMDGLGKAYSYEVELEPTGQNYLFALDYLSQKPKKSFMLADSQLVTKHKVNQLKHYNATSRIRSYNPNEWLSIDRMSRLKKLPVGYNAKTVKMMQQWKTQESRPEQLISRVLTLFATDEFYYSYSPPLLIGNTIDQFLFETKSGFCEHYASAFTFMMRAAGIPARVVTGYQGGIINEDYLLVKQSDAHAWSEVWVSDKGWLRVDPTAAVSPLRVEHGSQALMSINARGWLDNEWSRKLGERYDAIRHNWNKWVKDYNVTKQRALFEVFGFDSKEGKSIVIILGSIMLISSIFVLLFLYVTRPKRILNYYDKIYHKFLKSFANKGLVKQQHQGIQEFATHVSILLPTVKAEVNKFVSLYLKLRFSKYNHDAKNLDQKLLKLLTSINTKLKTEKALT